MPLGVTHACSIHPHNIQKQSKIHLTFRVQCSLAREKKKNAISNMNFYRFVF